MDSKTETVSDNWISVNDRLPKRGTRVRCLLSSHISKNVNERLLYRMKYNGKWNDYDHLVSHWQPINSQSPATIK